MMQETTMHEDKQEICNKLGSQLLSGLDTVEGRYLIADVARRMMERRSRRV